MGLKNTFSVVSWISLIILIGFSSINATSAESFPVKKLVIAGPPAGVSNGLIHLIKSNGLAELAEEVEFLVWTNPDQLRALVLNNKVDFIAMPTNVAANLYNRGAPLALLNVSQWGALWMVSRDPNMKTLADFKGQEIAVPFRADMPDIVFTHLAEKQGLSPSKDFDVRYTATPMDAMQLLIMRRIDHALLAEPAISMALRKTKSFPLSMVAPDLYRSVDLQKEWGRIMGGEARTPQAGIAVLGDIRHNAPLVAQFEALYFEAMLWCQDNPQACGKEVAEQVPMLSAVAVSDALAAQVNYYTTAHQAKAELEDFFQLLLNKQPASVGGKLPDAGFYANPNMP
ncbi:MAG: ABC transporter substrate-binding protein [Marinomonas foliarum]